MAGDEFKHIRLRSDDDEIVIQAGLVSPDPQSSPHDSGVPESAKGGDPDPSAQPVAAVSENAQAPEPAASQKPVDPEVDSYRETSLEDLREAKMNVGQRVILVLAVLALITAIVWYMFFR